MNDIHKDTQEHSLKKHKILILFGDLIANMLSNKKVNPIVTALFIRGRKLNISLLFITFYFFCHFFFYIKSPLRGEKNALTTEGYPLSEMSGTLLKMNTVPSNAGFGKQLIAMCIPMVFRCFSSSSLTVTKTLTTVVITVALTSHNLVFGDFF